MANSGPFLALPAEVREMILDLLLSSRYPENDPSYYARVRGKLYLHDDNHYIPTDHGIDARVLRTCRQIYEEGSGLLYSNHQFVVDRYGDCRLNVVNSCWHFLDKIGQRNVELIRSLSLSSVYGESQVLTTQQHMQRARNEFLKELLSSQPGLQSLDLLVIEMDLLMLDHYEHDEVYLYMADLGVCNAWPSVPTTGEEWQLYLAEAKKIDEFAFKWMVLGAMRIIQPSCPALTNVYEVLVPQTSHAIFTRKPVRDSFARQTLAKVLGLHGQVYALEVDVDSEIVRRTTWEDAGSGWT